MSIAIQELRIGNKVKVTISNDAGIYEVLGIPAWGMDGCGDGSEPLVLIDRCPKQLVPRSKLRGVRLSIEMMKKYGFDWDKMTVSKDRIWLAPGNGGYDVFLSGLTGGIFTNIKFLHQLQNLHFAMFGQELTITL